MGETKSITMEAFVAQNEASIRRILANIDAKREIERAIRKMSQEYEEALAASKKWQNEADSLKQRIENAYADLRGC